MSHFSVMVIGPKDESELAVAMAPFNESPEGGSPYLVWKDQEAEWREEFETRTTEMVRNTTTGELRFPWDDMFKVNPSESTGPVFPSGWEKCVALLKEKYVTFEAFCEEYHGSSMHDGRYGYWHNPNAKWDWWQLGGRWAGFLMVKKGSNTAGRGSQTLLARDDMYEGDPLRADCARLGDIDWDGMFKAAVDRAGKRWDAEMAEIAKRDKSEAEWRVQFSEMDAEIMSRFKRMCEHYRLSETWESYRLWSLNPLFSDVNFLDTKDRASHVAKVSVPSTFAFLKDGQWGERGEMGWFGLVRDEKDCGAWEKEFEQMLETLPEDTMIWIVDCHI